MQAKIEEAFAHLGAILMQTATSDDKIIIGHVRDAHGLLQDALRAPSPRASEPVAEVERLRAELKAVQQKRQDLWEAFCVSADELKRLRATPPSPSAGREEIVEQLRQKIDWFLHTEEYDHENDIRVGINRICNEMWKALSPSRTEGGQAEGGETDWYSKLPLAVRLRDEEGPPLPQMIAQQRAKQFLLTEDGEWNGPSYPRPSAPSRTAEEREALAAEIENFEEVILRTDDGPEWSDKRSLTDDEKDMLVAALRSSVAENEQRALLEKRFADRKSSSSVHDHTFSEGASPAPSTGEREAWQPIETAPRDGTAIFAYWTPTPQFVGDIGELVDVVRFTDGQWWGGDEFEDDYARSPTHWKPVGAPPVISPQPGKVGDGV